MVRVVSFDFATVGSETVAVARVLGAAHELAMTCGTHALGSIGCAARVCRALIDAPVAVVVFPIALLGTALPTCRIGLRVWLALLWFRLVARGTGV
jgi:hypothetical protein